MFVYFNFNVHYKSTSDGLGWNLKICIFLFYLFILVHWVFVVVSRLSLVAVHMCWGGGGVCGDVFIVVVLRHRCPVGS